MPPPLPDRIDRYEIVDRLGGGGMGVVYLAKDPLLGRTVAIKMLKEDNEELRERFAREARSAAALKHNNIVVIYDVGEDSGRPFLAMEYLDGETMAELIKRRAPVPLNRKLELMVELCAGLGYAHRSSIVHRDIKPANLMITSEGTLKILDFGIARVTAEATSSGLTQIGMLMGSPHYMSPEQADGLPVDERSDIFSVGLVLYELLSYTRAFPGETAHVVLHNILHKEPRPIRELSQEVDADLERVVGQALVKDPGGRYQTLAALAADLGRIRRQDREDETQVITRPGEPVRDRGQEGHTPTRGSRIYVEPKDIIRRRAEQIQSHLDEASGHFRAGRYEQAIDHSEKALFINPDEPRALEILQLTQRALDARQIRQWLGEAEALKAEGSLTGAERLIAQSLQLQPDSLDAQSSLLDLKERRRERERAAERARAVRSAVTKARSNIAAGAFEAAVRGANEALAFDAGHEEAKALLRQAVAAIDERNLKEAEARRVAEEEERRRQVADAEALRQEQLRQQEAERVAREEKQREREAEAARRAEAARQAEATRQAEAARQAEARRLADEEERRQQEEASRQAARQAERREREAEAARKAEVAKRADADRRAQAMRQAELDRQEADRRQREAHLEEPTVIRPEQTRVLVRKAEDNRADRPTNLQTPWHKKSAVIALLAALLVVGLGAGGWWLTRDSGADPPPGPVRTVDYARILAEAEAQHQRDPRAALALIFKIPNDAREHKEGQALLGRIRASAADAADAARKKAEASKATTTSDFRDGEARQKEASSLLLPEQTDRAVLLFQQAEQAFTRAASAEWTADQFVDEAVRLRGAGNLDRAIDSAVEGLKRDPRSQRAQTFLAERRSEALGLAREARRKAAEAGASEANSEKFRQAVGIERKADEIKSALQTQEAVRAYGDARRAYNDAATALAGEINITVARAYELLKSRDAVGAQAVIGRIRSRDQTNRALQDLDKRLKELQTELSNSALQVAVRNAEQFLKNEDPAGARDAIGQVRKLDARYPELQELDKRLRDLEVAIAKEQRITNGIRDSRGQTDAQALDTLRALQSESPADQRIRDEISRRTKAPAPSGPSKVEAAEKEAIQSVLVRFRSAFESLRIDNVKTVYPAAAAQDFPFQTMNKAEWIPEGAPDISLTSATDATARWKVTIQIDSTRGGRRPANTGLREFTLRKTANGWIILDYR